MTSRLQEQFPETSTTSGSLTDYRRSQKSSATNVLLLRKWNEQSGLTRAPCCGALLYCPNTYAAPCAGFEPIFATGAPPTIVSAVAETEYPRLSML
jgi:hypothetical protein